MTRVGTSLKDRGHYGRKAAGYTILVLLLPVVLLCEGGRKLGEVIYTLTSRLHRWMRPCLYAKRPQ